MINKNTVKEAMKLTEDILDDYIDALDRAYAAGEKGVKVAISWKFTPMEDDPKSIEVEADVSFTEKKIKDSGKVTVKSE